MTAITWQQSPERSTWVAEWKGARLAVTRLGLDSWQAEVTWQPGTPRERSEVSPAYRTRLAGQAWAARTARERREPLASPAGPYQTEREARETPQAMRAVAQARIACDRRAGITRTAGTAAAQRAVEAPNLVMLTDACAAADVELGAYDRRILAWLAGYEPSTCAVVAGVIRRAAGGAS